MALGAWACMIAATVACDFIKVEGTVVERGASASIERGIWKGSSTLASPGCGGYSGVYVDTMWNTSKAFSILACFFGFCAVAPLIFACGKKLFLSQIYSMSGGCINASIFSGLSLLLKRSSACDVAELTNRTCKLSTGGNLGIAATSLFAAAGILMNCVVVGAVQAQMAEEAEHQETGKDVEKGEAEEQPEQPAQE
jgi:hypothetical protein